MFLEFEAQKAFQDKRTANFIGKQLTLLIVVFKYMSNAYSRPTICGTLRTRQGNGVYDRIQKLTDIMQELKEDVKAEVTATENLERWKESIIIP